MKPAIEDAAEAWFDIPDELLKRSWNQLCPIDETTSTTEAPLPVDTADVREFRELNLPENDINEWSDPGYQKNRVQTTVSYAQLQIGI